MTTQLQRCCIAVVFFTTAMLLWWNFFGPASSSNTRLQSCQSNLGQIGLAMQQYQQDYSGRFPLAVIGATGTKLELKMGDGKTPVQTPVGWADAILPHLGTLSCYLCPLSDMKPSGRADQVGYTCYWFNTNLTGLTANRLAFPATTILVGEGGDKSEKTDATYRKTVFPAGWLTNRTTPAWRHSSGANYLFTDGHVAWLKPSRVVGNDGRSDALTVN